MKLETLDRWEIVLFLHYRQQYNSCFIMCYHQLLRLAQQKQGWCITFRGERGDPTGNYPIISTNGVEIDSTLMHKYFKNFTIYQGHHDHSRFGIIETLFDYLNKPFVYFYNNPKVDLLKTLISRENAIVLRIIVEYQFNKLSGEIQGLSKEKQATFFKWQEETHHWIDLYFCLLQLVEEKRDFYKPETFSRLIAACGNKNELELIQKSLKIFDKHLFIGDRDDYGIQRYIPPYWNPLSYMSLSDIQEMVSWIENKHQSWDKKLIVSAYLFFKIIFNNPLQLPENIDQNLVSAFSEAAKKLSPIKPSVAFREQGAVESFRAEFRKLFDNPKKEPHLLDLINIPGVKLALSILLYAPFWKYVDIISLQDIMLVFPEIYPTGH